MSALGVFNCPLCDKFKAPDFRLLLPHIRLVHSTRPGFSLQCNIDNCTRIFRNMKSYTNHIYGDHLSLPRSASTYCGSTIAASYDNAEEVTNGTEHAEESSTELHFEEPIPELKAIAANWILRIKECCKLTQSIVEEIIERVTHLIQLILYSCEGSHWHGCPEFNEMFDPNGTFGRPFKGLESSYSLLQYCKANLGLVVSFWFSMGTLT